jgi:hypothetical protein
MLSKFVYSIRTRSLQHALVEHLLNEIDAHCGNLILDTEVRWLSRRKFSFGFQDLPEAVEFFLGQTHLKDYWWLLHLAFLKDLTAELNELTTAY